MIHVPCVFVFPQQAVYGGTYLLSGSPCPHPGLIRFQQRGVVLPRNLQIRFYCYAHTITLVDRLGANLRSYTTETVDQFVARIMEDQMIRTAPDWYRMRSPAHKYEIDAYKKWIRGTHSQRT